MVEFAVLRRRLLQGFVLVWFVGLLLPNISLPNEKENAVNISKENRKITPFPSLNLIDKRFYTDLEKFYQDRLFGRENLIYAWSKLNYKCNVMLDEEYVKGKKGWLFRKKHTIKAFNDKELKLKKIKNIQNYCKIHDVDFIFIVPPYKNAVYSNLLPEKIRTSAPAYNKIENDLINSCKNLKINYLSLYKPLLKSKKLFPNDIYWWDDHHWSYEGASIAADTVLKYIKTKKSDFIYDSMPFDGTYKNGRKETSMVSALGVRDLGSGYTKVPWSKQFTDQIYGVDQYTSKQVQFKNEPISNHYILEKTIKGECLIFNKTTKNNFKILFLCDSYGGNMTTYMSQFVPYMINTHYLRKTGKKNNTDLKKLIKKYHPDIVILEIGAPEFFNSKGDTYLKHIVF